jgi:hypothetical protein
MLFLGLRVMIRKGQDVKQACVLKGKFVADRKCATGNAKGQVDERGMYSTTGG